MRVREFERKHLLFGARLGELVDGRAASCSTPSGTQRAGSHRPTATPTRSARCAMRWNIARDLEASGVSFASKQCSATPRKETEH